jgi:hypothetical protein
MQQKDLKIYIEKSFRFCKSENVEKEFSQLKTYIKLLNKKKEEFILKVITGKKTYPQLKAFYEAINQLLPQYNSKQEELGEMIFNEDEFKFILKYAGGWYKEIKNKNGDVIPIEKSFKDITKDEMIMVLKKIDRWAMMRGFSLCIDKELMDLIK